jgi:hypothetical protein
VRKVLGARLKASLLKVVPIIFACIDRSGGQGQAFSITRADQPPAQHAHLGGAGTALTIVPN